MNTDTSIARKTAVDWFYDEIDRIKKLLPKNHKMAILSHLPKEWDTAGGGRIIENVLNFRTTDMTVYEALKKVIGEQ